LLVVVVVEVAPLVVYDTVVEVVEGLTGEIVMLFVDAAGSRKGEVAVAVEGILVQSRQV
jgi:hypothetical protein